MMSHFRGQYTYLILMMSVHLMARVARVVAPGLPHHVTQRGNRRQRFFFTDDDFAEYQHLMASSCEGCGTQVWAYCLIPNHVHLIMVPGEQDGLRCQQFSMQSENRGCPDERAPQRGYTATRPHRRSGKLKAQSCLRQGPASVPGKETQSRPFPQSSEATAGPQVAKGRIPQGQTTFLYFTGFAEAMLLARIYEAFPLSCPCYITDCVWGSSTPKYRSDYLSTAPTIRSLV
jgi:hypothetical protein